MVGVRSIGDVHDERRGSSLIGTITAKERRAGAETQVDEGVLVRNRREGGAVADTAAVQAALVGCDQGGAVWPVIVSVGGGVNSEDDIDMALGLDKRVQGNVLSILAAIDDIQHFLRGVRRRVLVVFVEGVGIVRSDVVLGSVKLFQEVGENVLHESGERSGVNLEKELVEECG